MSEVDSAKILLFLAAAVALVSGVAWLFYSLAILFLCLVFAEAPAAPAVKAPKAAAKAAEAPVVIQSASDNGAMQLYNEILSSVIKDALESNRK